MLDGLLGSSFDDPKTMGLLQLASGLMSAPKVSQGLASGLLGYQQAIAQGKRAKMEEEGALVRKQMRDMQMQQMQQELTRRKAIEDAYRGAITTPAQQALAQGGGPTVANAQAMQGMSPGIDQNALIRGLAQADPMSAYQMMQPKPADYKVVGDALLQVGPSGVKEAYRAPAKPAELPSAVREYQFARDQGYQGTFQQFQLEQKRAGATNVRVDTGPKAFDTELGKMGVGLLEKGREGAQAAASTLESVGEIRKAAAGGAYQGAGADLKLGAAKALGALGMPYDAKTVANSELFSAQANQFVLNSIKGLGANPSNADREFIEKTVPRLQTDPAALPALLNFMEEKARRQIRSYNTQARQTQQQSPFLPFSLEVQEPALPSPKPANAKRQVVRTGTSNGRKVVQYSDGTIEYAD